MFALVTREEKEEVEARKCEQFNFKSDPTLFCHPQKANYGGERNV